MTVRRCGGTGGTRPALMSCSGKSKLQMYTDRLRTPDCLASSCTKAHDCLNMQTSLHVTMMCLQVS